MLVESLWFVAHVESKYNVEDGSYITWVAFLPQEVFTLLPDNVKLPSPYTFRLEDYDLLMNSGDLFCRKVSTKDSEKLINKIYKTLTKKDVK